ncbi:hypothetical protein NQZ68_038892 [Dissostichus eleginoides]|uniref:Zinc finger CCCH domain containing protein 32 n=1 Tax=Dissostichus eleginoides TaxID=100907 RepID=A0AAD9F2C4_DISEL|nr:hypothetical protein NQZ68_038892 [Dissostichus eleginoides]KAK1886192.1 Zinc finger CCCH domain containing protein 32 [Dissostichus eleginoides]
MNSLVGYGVSSESDSEGEEDVKNGAVGSVKKLCDEASSGRKTRNFMLESGSASSESEPEEDYPSSSPHPQKPAPPPACHPTLPAPSLDSITSNKLPPPSLHTCSGSSVFTNPFKAQADQKLSALQKHVPLTMQAKPSQIGGKRMCVAYRKNGRCRFGIKCKFAHDSDLQSLTDLPVSEETPDQEEALASGSGSQKETKEEESAGQQGKKRRVGLSNTLIPPKRAMKQYAIQRSREQLHMS